MHSPLRLALLGYGKMGQMVEKIALERGHTLSGIKRHKKGDLDLHTCDVAIDFSSSESVIPHIHLAGKAKKNIVIGTTGWDHEMDEAKKLVKKYQIGALYAPNFSIGVHLFLKLLAEANRLFSLERGYDTGGVEIHHRQKKDAPSGTAKALANMIEKERPEPVHFASLRVGALPGIHTLYFDSDEDTITLTHTAKGRDGFALGAVIAAEWIKNQQGFFTLEDII